MLPSLLFYNMTHHTHSAMKSSQSKIYTSSTSVPHSVNPPSAAVGVEDGALSIQSCTSWRGASNVAKKDTTLGRNTTKPSDFLVSRRKYPRLMTDSHTHDYFDRLNFLKTIKINHKHDSIFISVCVSVCCSMQFNSLQDRN